MNQEPPFKIGDVISVNPEYEDRLTNVLRTVTNIKWVGKTHCESGWLVDAKAMNPVYGNRQHLEGYDSGYFIKE